MRVYFRAEQRADCYQVIRAVVAKFEREDVELAAIANGAMPDGYSRNSMPGPGQAGGVSDRTAQTVIIRSRDDDAASRAFGLIWQAARLLEQADSERHRALPRMKAGATVEDGCKSHARMRTWIAGEEQPYFEPRIPDDEVHRKRLGQDAIESGLCEWCWSWKQNHGGDWPLVALLEERAKGRRITDKLVAEVDAAEARRQRELQQPKKSRRAS